MKILVPLKRVVDPYAKVKPLADGTGIDTSGVKFEINPFDEIAVEEAVRQREKDPSIEVTVVSIGGPECEEQLRKALAIGADKAVLIETNALFDSPGVAGELAAFAREIQPDLILMGKQATDDDNGQAAQMLAAKLDWPEATFASKLDLDGKATLPAVVTTDLRLNEPRYIALPGIIKARSKPLEKRPAQTNPSAKTRITKVEAPAPRAAGRKVSSVAELVNALKERGVL